MTDSVAIRETLDAAVVRFAGDSGDGMQLTGTQFTLSTALHGNDLATFPDYPAEIRAPAGTTFGVSSFQINFGSSTILTPGDQPDVLVVMNPAALKVHMPDLKLGGLIIADEGAFTERNLVKAGFDSNPLEDGSTSPYQLFKLDISSRTLDAVAPFELSQKEGLRCKNFWTLGLILWMFGREREPVVKWVNKKFASNKTFADANVAALNAGHAYAETTELGENIVGFSIPPAKVEPGLYRTVTGTDALAIGLVAGCKAAGRPMVFASYPITPASPVLHALSRMKAYGVTTFQAEDEIAAVCAAIGASYGGAIGITSSSGPGIALKGEAIGLAISTELPLVIVNSQRAGPSTGMPTKSEQGDLYQAMYGRNSDAPLPVLATATPSDCFEVGIEAVRLAVKFMTPVMLLTDGYLSNAAEPWLVPDADEIPTFDLPKSVDPEGFHPFRRDPDTLARNWPAPGTPGLEHRIGGIEKNYNSGNISYDPDNHQKMTDTRAAKVAGIARFIPEQTVTTGPGDADLAVVGWGSTFGALEKAVGVANEQGLSVAHIHIRYLNPFPSNLEALLKSFDKVMIAELNSGQLNTMLRDQFLIPTISYTKVTGQPFKTAEVLQRIQDEIGGR